MTAIASRSFANLADLSTDDLRKELAQALEVTADNLVWLARLWRELERRGEDLRELRTGLRNFLPLIADGKLDAQAAVQFAGNLTMLRALGSLPIAEQRRIAAGGTVKAVLVRDGEISIKAMRADEMRAGMIRQVFATGRVRSEDEQRLIVTTLHPERVKQAGKKQRVSVDADRLTLWRRVAAKRGIGVEALIAQTMDAMIEQERQNEKGDKTD